MLTHTLGMYHHLSHSFCIYMIDPIVEIKDPEEDMEEADAGMVGCSFFGVMCLYIYECVCVCACVCVCVCVCYALRDGMLRDESGLRSHCHSFFISSPRSRQRIKKTESYTIRSPTNGICCK